MFLFRAIKNLFFALLRLVIFVVIVAALAIGAANALVILSSSKNVVSVQAAKYRDADAVVVLGASVNPDGSPSTILKDRLDDAVLLYGEGAAPKIIVSGDNGDLRYNESAAMKRYLVAQGIPSTDVFCDYAGFSTYESMYRVRHVFGCTRIVVATNEYHLPRALYDAQALGMQAIGVPSDFHNYANLEWYNFREIGARVRDVAQCFMHTPPTFVGEPIDIKSSGDVF